MQHSLRQMYLSNSERYALLLMDNSSENFGFSTFPINRQMLDEKPYSSSFPQKRKVFQCLAWYRNLLRRVELPKRQANRKEYRIRLVQNPPKEWLSPASCHETSPACFVNVIPSLLFER
jgi:hypothetical protein